ncbi:hypothetical protein O6H91_01G013500 [Diphasiastrum complanatum]|uniref:Uncharacterized protein n=1 Tax=Diphasiastrum complanatum TaxID=34168 RepID=A0ACC2EN53_DIPCM|nr:hypothetical protein O6H91_01G013500 [Diphasiastrum complanatum]
MSLRPSLALRCFQRGSRDKAIVESIRNLKSGKEASCQLLWHLHNTLLADQTIMHACQQAIVQLLSILSCHCCMEAFNNWSRSFQTDLQNIDASSHHRCA